MLRFAVFALLAVVEVICGGIFKQPGDFHDIPPDSDFDVQKTPESTNNVMEADRYEYPIFIGEEIHIRSRRDATSVADRKKLNKPAEIETKSNNGWTPLHFAACSGNSDILQFLIQKGAKVDSTSNPENDSLTPMHVAALCNQKDILQLILSNGGEVDGKSENGWTPFLYSASKGHLEIATLLIEKGCDIHVKSTFQNGSVQAIHIAAEYGQTDIAQLLLDKGADVSATENQGWTPLHYAVWKGRLELIQLLLQRGASVSTRTNSDNKETESLHVAVDYEQRDVVQLLLDQGVNVNSAQKEGLTPLHYAAQKGNLEIAQLLIDKGAKVDTHAGSEKYRKTPIHEAVEAGHRDIVQLLLSKGASVHAVDTNGLTPLHYAAWEDDSDVAKLLIDSGSNISATTRDVSDLLQPIHVAAMYGYADFVRLLLEKGANIEALNKNGWAPLHYAVSYYSEAAEVLVKAGAKIDSKSSDGDDRKQPIHVAANWGRINCMQLLLNEGANLEAKDKYSQTPLHKAVQGNQLPAVRFLAEQNANITAKNNQNKTPSDIAREKGFHDIVEFLSNTEKLNEDLIASTELGNEKEVDDCLNVGAQIQATALNKGNKMPLHIATEEGHIEVVQTLLRHKANLEVRDDKGWTPLHYAAWKDRLEIAQILIQNGAQIDAKSNYENDYKLPIHVAASNGQANIIKLLLDSGAMIEAVDRYGSTALHYASSKGHFEAAKMLIENGAEKSAKLILCNENKEPIHVAVSNGQVDILKLLLDQGVDIEAPDRHKESPLHRAASEGQFEAVKLLVERNADISVKNIEDKTPSDLAKEKRRTEIVHYLQNIENLNKVLLESTEKGDNEKVVDCIQQGAQIEVRARDKDNKTPLQIASEAGHKTIVETLLRNKANIEIKDNHGFTLLHYAAWKGQLEVAKFLIDSGAKVNSVALYLEKQPVHVAAYYGQKEMLEFLLSAGCEVDARDSNGWTPLHYAVWRGHVQAAQLLLDNGADLEAKSLAEQGGEQAIHVAVVYEQEGSLKLLLDAGADIEAKDERGDSPLNKASAAGKLAIVKMLLEKSVERSGK